VGAGEAAAVSVTRQPAPKLGGYVGLAALLLFAGLAAGRPELVAVAAPFALLVVAGLGSAREPAVSVTAAADTDRAVEGDELMVTLTLTAATAVSRLEVLLLVPGGLSRAGATALPAHALRLRRGERRTVALRLRCDHWGAYQLGTVLLRAHDPLRLQGWEWQARASLPLVVFPKPETVRVLVQPFETQVFTGNQVARQRGDGIEFADVRPFQPGDRARSINWRATARRGVPWVNQRHPERNTDVVLFLDSFADVPTAGGLGAGVAGRGTLDRAVGAAASLASAYLARRDRVGLVGFGGVVRWLHPGSGQAALYRLLDTLMETESFATVGWRNIHQLPPRTLPPKALILALSPLLDDRATAALFDLRARGYDLAVIDVSPLLPSAGDGGPATPADRPVRRGRSPRLQRRLGGGRGSGGTGTVEALALRLWALERAARRRRYQQLGVAVVEWPPGTPTEQVVVELELARRRSATAAWSALPT
jgi:uncharacterized protein (DUF58 family)